MTKCLARAQHFHIKVQYKTDYRINSLDAWLVGEININNLRDSIGAPTKEKIMRNALIPT